MGQSKGMSRLKLAEQMINQRKRTAEQAIYEFENVEQQKLQEALRVELKIADLKQRVFDADNQSRADVAALNRDHQTALGELQIEHSAAMDKLRIAFAEKTTKVNAQFQTKLEKVRADAIKAEKTLTDANCQFNTELANRRTAINEKAASMRLQLSQDTQTAIDKLYEAELGPDLKAVVDAIPSLTDLANAAPRISHNK